MIYIASPFFNEEQLNFVKEIEKHLSKNHITYFSPRQEGPTLKDLPPDERQEKALEVYNMNIEGIEYSDALIAVIDDFDPGTMFEIGYAAACDNIGIITLTNNFYGLNVMLSQAIDAHTLSIDQAVKAYFEWMNKGKVIIHNSYVRTDT